MNKFADLKFFLMFIGYPRSGHSLIGSLLDAHPHMIVAHEYNVFEPLRQNQPPEVILEELYENSKRFQGKRTQTGYDYTVPNQYQGTYKSPLSVIGDKKGGKTTLLFMKNHEETLKRLQTFQAKINLPFKFIHVVRNPFDNIATMALHEYCRREGIKYSSCLFCKERPLKIDDLLERNIHFYLQHVEKNSELSQSDIGDIHTLYTEDVIENPKKQLKQLYCFLDQSADESYFKDCCSIVMKTRKMTRNFIQWPSKSINQVMEAMKSFPVLEKYRS
jgi:hypothetical protein